MADTYLKFQQIDWEEGTWFNVRGIRRKLLVMKSTRMIPQTDDAHIIQMVEDGTLEKIPYFGLN